MFGTNSTATAANSTGSGGSFINSQGVLAQVLVGFLSVLIVYILLAALEAAYNFVNRLHANRTDAVPARGADRYSWSGFVRNPSRAFHGVHPGGGEHRHGAVPRP